MTAPPHAPHRRPEDRRLSALYRRTALILRIGFTAAATLMIVGVIVSFARGEGFAEEVTSLADLPGQLRSFEGEAFIDLGILVLLATPLAYVVVALVTFARQRDLLFVGVCLALIAILSGSVGLALL